MQKRRNRKRRKMGQKPIDACRSNQADSHTGRALTTTHLTQESPLIRDRETAVCPYRKTIQFYKTPTKYSKIIIRELEDDVRLHPYVLDKEQRLEYNAAVIDDEMIKRGRPYYQIYPEVFEAVSNTTLNLSMEMWKVPFDIFEIRMPKTETPLIPVESDSTRGVISIQVFKKYYKRLIVQTDEGISLSYEYLKNRFPFNPEDSIYSKMNRIIIKVNICDYNNPNNDDLLHYLIILLDYDKTKTIQRIVDEAIDEYYLNKVTVTDNPNVNDISRNSWIKIMELTLGVSLLATASQKVLEYDVLSKHIEAYRKMRDKGDNTGCQKIEALSKKKGKYGWNIEKPCERRLPLSQGDSYSNSKAKKRQHSYRSQRCGHWHTFLTGHGRQKISIKWVNSTIVRPDLPYQEFIVNNKSTKSK